jgi:hypothetical protein
MIGLRRVLHDNHVVLHKVLLKGVEKLESIAAELRRG